jgi:putative effector of murein hydrolase LrgA (UPF0299 family)
MSAQLSAGNKSTLTHSHPSIIFNRPLSPPAGVMYVADVAIKAALLSAGIKFPGPLVGMFGVVVALLAVGDKAAAKTLSWFGPSLQWIAKWLPLFYVASLVTLPLNLSGIAGACADLKQACVCCACHGWCPLGRAATEPVGPCVC